MRWQPGEDEINESAAVTCKEGEASEHAQRAGSCGLGKARERLTRARPILNLGPMGWDWLMQGLIKVSVGSRVGRGLEKVVGLEQCLSTLGT